MPGASPRSLSLTLLALRAAWWVALAAGAVAGLALVLAAAGATTAVPLIVPVSLDLAGGAVAIGVDEPAGTVVEVGRAEAWLRLTAPDLVTTALRVVLVEVYVAGALAGLHLLRRLTEEIARGRPFVVGNARRLRSLAGLVAGVTAADIGGRALLYGHLDDVLDVTGARFVPPVEVPVVPAVTALGLLAVGQAFRHGTVLQRDAESTV